MPLPPSRRDTFAPGRRGVDLGALTRHQGSSLRGRDPGYLDGRWATPQPFPNGGGDLFDVGDSEGGDSGGSVLGEDGDRLTLTNLKTQVWALTYTPIAETVHLRFHPAGGAGIPWLRGEHFDIDDDSNLVTISASSLAAARAQIGDVFSAQYLLTEGDTQEAIELDELVLRSGVNVVDPAATGTGTVALPADTQVGDLIIIGNATMKFDGTAGTGTVSDPRMTQVGHGAWVGIATDLSSMQFANPGLTRHTIAMATFANPAYYLNDGDAGPGAGPSGSLTAPVVAATGAILVVTEDNPNDFLNPANAVPSGYTVAVDPANGAAVCKAGIWYWQPDGTSSSPAGSITYLCHASGFAYATTIGLQGVPA